MTLSHIARVILGTMLSCAILLANIPSLAVASGPMCTLACCAGRAPHAAGSCMNGSCQAFLKGRAGASHNHRQSPAQQSEQLCGLPRLIARTTSRLLRESAIHAVRYSSERLNEDRASFGAHLSTSTVGQPCQPDCGIGTFSSSSQSRPRDTGATSHADKPAARESPASLHQSESCSTKTRHNDLDGVNYPGFGD